MTIANNTTALVDMAKNQDEMLMPYIPDGVNPATYVRLVESVMGVDKNGNLRPAEDMMIFLHVSKKLGLDPMAKQIYPVYRWDSSLGREKMTIQTGIDGFRLIAQRSGQYAGQKETEFETKEGVKFPLLARVTVLKSVNGQIVETTATARWEEYVQISKDGNAMGLWGSKPYTMLEKVAESKALRKAFPSELAGLYATEEMPENDIKKEIPVYKPQESTVAPTPLEVEVDEDKL